MVKGGAEQGFFLKALDDFAIGVFEFFDDNGTFKGRLQGFVNISHAAFADFFKNFVRTNVFGLLCHGSLTLCLLNG